ncbi:hypothetical protein WDW37_14695 [Bdellovibrionota bacterium FG-1]
MTNKNFWILYGGMVISLTSLSIARGAVPSSVRQMRVTDDTAIYERLSEIKAGREAKPDFDGDLKRLSNIQPHYREKLPSRLASPMKRIAAKQYRYSLNK